MGKLIRVGEPLWDSRSQTLSLSCKWGAHIIYLFIFFNLENIFMQVKKTVWDFLADSVLVKVSFSFPAGNLFSSERSYKAIPHR